MNNLKLNQSVCYSNEEMKQMKKLAAEGDIAAQVELAAIEIEDAVDVEKNHAFLKEQAEKGNTHALIDLGFIYMSNITRTEADGAETVLIAENNELSENCFLKAAELGSAHGMCIVGVHKYFKVWTGDDKDITPQDFLDAEKWLTAALTAFENTESDLSPIVASLGMDSLSELYAKNNPKNPIYNEEKAAFWKKRYEEFN